MNASAQVGGLVGSVAYGYIVERFGSYDAPFVPMAALLFLGCLIVAQGRRSGGAVAATFSFPSVSCRQAQVGRYERPPDSRGRTR